MTLLFWICSSRLGEPDMLVRQVLTDYYAYESLKMAGCEIKLAGDLTFFKKLFLFPVVDFCDEVALFSKTKTDNPSSNSTWNRTQYLSIKRSQTWSVPVIYACLITALSLKTAKFGKFGNFLVFLDWKMLGAHGACVCRVQKSKWSSQNVRLALSYTW
jgi:hypothetical protein